MKSRDLAKRMIVVSKNYYDSAFILNEVILTHRNTDIIYPVAYLLRHSLELILKSLILQTVPNQKLNLTDIAVEINENYKKFDVTRTHSLKVLLNKWIEIFDILAKDGLALFGLDELKGSIVNLMIEEIDNIDHSSETYRFPISKNGQMNNTDFYVNSEFEDIAGEIKPETPGYFVFGNNDNGEFDLLKHIYVLDESIMTVKDNLIYLIEMLIKYSKYYDMFKD